MEYPPQVAGEAPTGAAARSSRRGSRDRRSRGVRGVGWRSRTAAVVVPAATGPAPAIAEEDPSREATLELAPGGEAAAVIDAADRPPAPAAVPLPQAAPASRCGAPEPTWFATDAPGATTIGVRARPPDSSGPPATARRLTAATRPAPTSGMATRGALQRGGEPSLDRRRRTPSAVAAAGGGAGWGGHGSIGRFADSACENERLGREATVQPLLLIESPPQVGGRFHR